MFLLVIHLLLRFVIGLDCSESVYQKIVLDPTNPFHKQQFNIDPNDFKGYYDALQFGFWSQFRPYQDIIEVNQVGNPFQPSESVPGALLFSIQNLENQLFETVYFLYYPLFNDYIFHALVQFRPDGSATATYVRTQTKKYEGRWVYSHFQYVPWRQLIYLTFVTYQGIQLVSVPYQVNQYGMKQITIGGTGKIYNSNLEQFHGRMSRPVSFQLEIVYDSYDVFVNYFNSCNEPKSCQEQIKIDIQKDLLYMDSTMYLTKTISLYENAYSIGGWVKLDISNIHIRTALVLIRATINQKYSNNQFLGDRSLNLYYSIDFFGNKSLIAVDTYSYNIPIKGLISDNGNFSQVLFGDTSKIQDGIQQWHYIQYVYGIILNNQRIEQIQILFPLQGFYYYHYFFLNDIEGNQFTTDLMYLHIGVDKYQIQSQFRGWISDFHIQTCINKETTKMNAICHYSCYVPYWGCFKDKCQGCPPDSHRIFLDITGQCQCEEGYYTVLNQPICENFQENFNSLIFRETGSIQFDQCQFGYFQYQNQCYECPLKLIDKHKVSCLDCIKNKVYWYLNPICQSDYIKLIGGVDEPFYSINRPINEMDLFKINSLNHLELCQGCFRYCDSLSSECFLSNNYHLGKQIIVQCKNNYYFDQSNTFNQINLDLLECSKCIDNCEICHKQGYCDQCTKQHYFDPLLLQCLQCDIRCEECQFDLQLKQQICTSCPTLFTLYNGICLKCGIYCKFCKADHYLLTGEVYPRCLQCNDNRKNFISFDGINCHTNTIENCVYAFQYYQFDRHIQTIDMIFEPRPLDSTIITACAKCKLGYLYIISEQICVDHSIDIMEYSIQENRDSPIVCLSGAGGQGTGLERIQLIGGCQFIENCDGCMISKTDQMLKCSWCNVGFYMQKLKGNCLKCPPELNCLVCQQQQKINKDYFKLEFKAFYEWFVNFDGKHNYEDYAQSYNIDDYEIVCSVCIYGSQPIEGRCVKDCPLNCAECTYNNGEFQCLRCYDTIQGIMRTLVNNQCIQCPYNCAVCLPQETIKIYQYNPYFSSSEYQYFTNLCLQPIYELQAENLFYDPEIGNYVNCGDLNECEKEVQFEMIVHCNDFKFDELLSQSANQIKFKQQNIKLSQLFSQSAEPHIPEYQNDVVYLTLNEKFIKKMNQTFIFTNQTECVIFQASQLQSQFSRNVYSIKQMHLNLIARDDNVKLYFTNYLQLNGFTHVSIQNIQLISIATFPINEIIISHLINVDIALKGIQLNSLSSDSTIIFTFLNSSNIQIMNLKASQLNYETTHLFNILSPQWIFEGIIDNQIMNVQIQELSILNCTFTNSSLLHNLQDTQYIYSFYDIQLQADFINSYFFTQAYETQEFTNKTISFDSINIQSKIIDSKGFINFQYINVIRITNLTYENSQVSNSIFILSNNGFQMNSLSFTKIKMTGNSTLLKYESSIQQLQNDIVISKVTVAEVSYEQIYAFIYFVNQAFPIQLKICNINLKGNLISEYQQKKQLKMYYYSALIYIEMPYIYINDSNISRMPGFYEFSFVNTQNITFHNLNIQQLEPIKGLHQYLDCQQNQIFGIQYHSVISIYKARFTQLDNIYANKLTLYNHPLIQYQSTDTWEQIQFETVNISNSNFVQNMILVTRDIKSCSIIMLKSEQPIDINIQNLQFTQNQLNTYSKGIYINSCLINIQCPNGTVQMNQLEAIDNLVTNSTDVLLYSNQKSLVLTNSIFLRNNLFDIEKIKVNLMWSLPKDQPFLTIESLQNIFPIKSEGFASITFNTIIIQNVTLDSGQGCKGGGFQLYSKERGTVSITNSSFFKIKPSINCDQSFGGVFYIDASQSELLATINQIKVDQVMSLNQGGFIYLLSATNKVSLTISNIVANNYQSLQGSFLYAPLQQSDTLIQQVFVYNCSLKNQFADFIEYLGYLSIFKSLDRTSILNNRVQFYLKNGQLVMKNLIIHSLNYETFLSAINCILLSLNQLNFGEGNYTNNPLFNIQFQSSIDQKLSLEKIMISNLKKFVCTSCKIQEEFTMSQLTFSCQENIKQFTNFRQIITKEYLINRGQCFLEQVNTFLNYSQFSLFQLTHISQLHQIKMNEINLQNIECSDCQSGLLNLQFSQGKDNLVQIFDLQIFNSSCGTYGCLMLSSGVLKQSPLLQNNRLLNTLEEDYYAMNYSFKIYRYNCLNNIATFGACLFINNVELQVIDSKFLNNQATQSGGALYSTNIEESLSIIKSTFKNNSAKLGYNLIYENQILPNLTNTQSICVLNKSNVSQIVGVPQQLKISTSNHKYQIPNIHNFKNSSLQIDFSKIEDQFYFPNGQPISEYQYFDLHTDQYVQLNQSFRLIALNIYDKEQIKLDGTKCSIQSRIVKKNEENTEFSTNYTNFKKVEFNSTSKDYNLDKLILYYGFDQSETSFLQLQFHCDSIKVPIYSDNHQYNVQGWHDQYFLRTALIKPLPCQIGEINEIQTHTCQLCDPNLNQYSVTFNSNKCETKNELTMISVNPAQINLKQFYWRPYVNANIIGNCFNLQKNCVGGWKYGDKSCFEGHIGALCEQCDLYNIRGKGQFSISGAYTCGSCQSITQNMLIICLVSIFTLLSIIISVKSTDDLVTDLSKWTRHMTTGILVANEKAMAGILIKILTNYLQIVGSLGTFKLQMPIWITSVINTSSDPIQQMAYSLDCFLIDMFKIPILYGRILWHLLMPAIYIFASIIIFQFLIKRQKKQKLLKIGIIFTIFIYTIIFLQPNIIKSLIASISYRNISGYKWVQGHVAYRYDSDQHLEWMPYLISVLIFIGINIPLFFYYKLYVIKDNLNKLRNRQNWGFLYNEYTKWAFYWEIVKIFMKEIIIIILTYYEDTIFLKAILINLCLIIYSHYLREWQPYNLSFLNRLEYQSSTTCSISMIIGVGIYISQQQYIFEVQYPFFLILFIYNVKFLHTIILQILIAYIHKFQMQIDELKQQIRQRFPRLCQTIPQCNRLLEDTTLKKRKTQMAFKKIVQGVMAQLRLMSQAQKISHDAR